MNINPYNHIKTTVLELVTFIRNEVPHSEETEQDLEFIENFFFMMKNSDLADHVKLKVLPLEEEISERNTDFFLSKENRGIFSIVPEEKYKFFTDAIKNKKVPEEAILCIFDYFDTLIELVKLIK